MGMEAIRQCESGTTVSWDSSSSSSSSSSSPTFCNASTTKTSRNSSSFERSIPWITWFLIEFRWIFVVPIVLPLSFLYEQVWNLRQLYYDLFQSAPKLHDQRVARIQRDVKKWVDSGRQGGLLCTARKEWLSISIRPSDYKSLCNKIEIDLYDVLEIDTVRKVVRVEPGVSMGQLTLALKKKGFTIPIVPELDDLTVGGLVNGYGIEGSSHKYGLFCDICDAFEVVLGDGRLVRCTPTNEFKDLFFGLPWSYGALGFLVAVEIQIIPAKSWVKLVYRPVSGSVDDISLAFEQAISGANIFEAENESAFADAAGVSLRTKGKAIAAPRSSAGSMRSSRHRLDATVPSEQPEFVEGIMYGRNAAVIMTGQMVHESDIPPFPFRKTNRIGLWYKPWFYKHVESIFKEYERKSRREGEAGVVVEYIPLRDYYHRHTRSIFWQGELIIPFGNQFWFRWLLGWMMPPKISFLKLTQTKSIRQYHDEKMVVQDLLVPLSTLSESLDFFDRTFKCYPIWLCPHKTMKTNPQGFLKPSTDLPEGIDYEMYVDIGMYFVPGVKNYHAETALRAMEKYLRDNRGYQALYAQTLMTRKEYREMFDCTLYDQLRIKYGAQGVFMDAYDKVKKSNAAH